MDKPGLSIHCPHQMFSLVFELFYWNFTVSSVGSVAVFSEEKKRKSEKQ